MQNEEGMPMLYLGLPCIIAQCLHNINADYETKLNITAERLLIIIEETKLYFVKILHAMAIHGSLKPAKAILPKNCRKSIKLTQTKLRLY